MPAAKSTKERVVYQIKITLRESKPPIWRRVQVSDNTTLHKLHWIVQAVMGWTNSHLHQFIIDGDYYSQPDFEIEDVLNEETVRLKQVVSRPKFRFSYEYDFGDNWNHEIAIEKTLLADPQVRYPVCLTGKRACPPDDVGGVWGYNSFLEAIKDPNHEEHDGMLTWIGGSFDPEEFDVEAVNRDLKRLR